MERKERRRSPRVETAIPLKVSWNNAKGKLVVEQAYTEAFSNLGARVRLKEPIEVGQEITLINQQNQESMLGRVVWASEDATDEGRLVAFTFLTPSSDFWGTVAYGG